ncbi:hypothetical protein RHECNPAF_430020 [Rhizobium etli CNPAF512]|nr:hypothetical protein RHECNPAF_430020 [Rhizobium etli CNPAF512]
MPSGRAHLSVGQSCWRCCSIGFAISGRASSLRETAESSTSENKHLKLRAPPLTEEITPGCVSFLLGP